MPTVRRASSSVPESKRCFTAILNEDAFEEFSSGPYYSKTFEWVAQNEEKYCADLVDSECKLMTREQIRFRIYLTLRDQVMLPLRAHQQDPNLLD